MRRSRACWRYCLWLLAPLSIATAHARAPDCNPAQLAEILAPASHSQPSVALSCSATLPVGSRISKALHFNGAAASGVVLDCNGSLIQPSATTTQRDAILIQSQPQQTQWQRPHNITIRNCTINGSVRIQGMAANGEGAALRASSQRRSHTERAQQAAPADIVLDQLNIIGQGRIPLYLAPGVSRVTLQHSRIGGRSNSVALYLDAESAGNIFQYNTFDSRTRRELVAIDGSAENIFRHNRFATLSHGGLYLYRNCGEGGTVRHQTPSRNIISNNIFDYRHNHTRLPAVWLGARNGNRRYCEADAGFPFGSSSDNRDHARDNRITNNRFYRLNPQAMLQGDTSANIVRDNVTVR